MTKQIRMGQNTIGTVMKSMASCLMTNKNITNHSVRKTLVTKLKKSGKPRNCFRLRTSEFCHTTLHLHNL